MRILGILAVLLIQASHAGSFTANSLVQKQSHSFASLRGGGGSCGRAQSSSPLALGMIATVARRGGNSTSNASSMGTPVHDDIYNTKEKAAVAKPIMPPLSNIDIGAFWIHFCAAVTMTLPVMIVPMMDVELLASSSSTALARGASLAATMAFRAPMGNGIGKLVNGLVCQQLGGPKSSRLYFLGSTLAALSLASVSLTTTEGLWTTENLGWMVGSIEFCASIQWTVCSLFLSQYYKTEPALFARGVTVLALSSTGGQIFAKVLGASLLQFLHWRHVARLCVLVAISGFSFSVWTSRNMARAMKARITAASAVDDEVLMLEKQQTSKSSPKEAIRKVVGSPVFWCIGLAHVSGYLTRTSDRILGSFLQEITALSPQICGGLTAFMTVGFLYGLVTTSRKFHQQSAIQPKLQLLRKGYIRYLLSASGLIAAAAFGKTWHPYLSATIITLCASIMAASIAFPFFQVPNMVSSIYFGDVKPVALSLMDGTGVILTAPIWKVFNRILLPNFGWSASWSAIAVIVGVCGTLLMRTMPRVLELQKQQQEDS